MVPSELIKYTSNFDSIPQNWSLTKIKYIAETIPGGTPSTSKNEYWENGNIPWLQSGKLKNSNILAADKFITELGLKSSSTKMIKRNTTLVALTGATCANVGYLTFEACANQSVIAINENENKAESRFLFYSLLNIRNQILINQTGGAQAGVNNHDISNLQILLPSKQTQIRIAEFLDEKVGEIDTIIEKKEVLLLRLEEKKRNIINEVVTKGLNPNVTMKDSGIEWIGEIPVNWNVSKLKYLVSLNSNEKLNDLEFKLALDNIESWTGSLKSNESSEFEGIGNVFCKGDVLFNKLRPYLAKVYHAEMNGICVNELLVLSCLEFLLSKFLFYRMISPAFIEIVNSSTYGAKMPRANWNFIGDIPIPLPGVEEQSRIILFLDKKQTEFTYLVNKVQLQIEKLKEYRQTLISEAVTGKLEIA